MTDVNEAVIARLSKSGKTFEILVDCEKAIAKKHGEDIPMDDLLTTTEVFSDIKKGMHSSEQDLKQVFGDLKFQDIALQIIKDGEVQLTSKYRDKLRDEKRKRIVSLIHRNAVNPETNLPHPPVRIENALAEAKVKIDEFKKPEDQISNIIDQIRTILPIKYEIREVAFKIPPEFAGKSYSILKQYGKLIKDEWQNDGSLVAIIEVPAGLQNELFEKLNHLTQGQVESKIVEK